MSNSTHASFVVPINLETHPNADTLSIVEFEGFTMCVRTDDWIGVNKGIHIQPDSIIDTRRPEFAFLADGKKDKIRVGVKKLRGIISYGFLIPLPEGQTGEIGEDFAERLGIEHYEPPIRIGRQSNNNIKAPPGDFAKYDIDNVRKYHKVFHEGEMVQYAEKIHGASSRFVFSSKQDKMCVGSRRQWKSDDDKCPWWRVFHLYPQIGEFCRAQPDWVLYGEVYGQVQNLKYGKSGVAFAAFDIRTPDLVWVDPDDFGMMCGIHNIPTVPIIARGEFSLKQAIEHSNGPSLIPGADHHREGCVIRPLQERTDRKIGRVILKCVGTDYLTTTKKGL